MNKYQ
jgi:hypothetical protein